MVRSVCAGEPEVLVASEMRAQERQHSLQSKRRGCCRATQVLGGKKREWVQLEVLGYMKVEWKRFCGAAEQTYPLFETCTYPEDFLLWICHNLEFGIKNFSFLGFREDLKSTDLNYPKVVNTLSPSSGP